MNSTDDSSAQELVNLITAKWSTHLIASAAELGIADLLAESPKRADQLADQIGSSPLMTYRLLRALAGLGLLRENSHKEFELTPMGRHIRHDTTNSLRALAIMLAKPWHNRAWEHLTVSIRTGRSASELAFGTTLWSHLDGNPEDLENFNEAMVSASTNIHYQAAEAYDFSGIGVLVDVGGGYGRLLGAILQRYPEMRGKVFDRPHLKEGALAEFNRLGVESRCEFAGGDFLSSVVEGGDAYLMSHITHDWPDEAVVKILRNCRNVMQQGQKLLVLDAVIKSTNEPDWGKLMDMEMAVLFGGRDRTVEEFGKLFRDAGFDLSQVVPTKSTTSIVEGIAN